jgi:uncharacterized protein (DUF1919 family)
MNDSNARIAPDKIGVLSPDIICCTACGTCWQSGYVTYYIAINDYVTYTQNKFYILHHRPLMRRNLVLCKFTVVGKGKEVIDSLLHKLSNEKLDEM